MKIEQSKPEQAEAWVYGMIGFTKGVYRQYIKPTLDDYPIMGFMLSGVIGGIAVSKLIEKRG